MKNILILGASRSGKSTLANMFAERLGFSIIDVDAFIGAFKENYPDLGFDYHSEKNHLIAPFISSYVNATTYNHPQIRFVVEGYHIKLSDAVKLFSDNFEIVVLGYPQLTGEQVLANVRKYEGKFDYTRAISDEQLLKTLTRHVEYSKKIKAECKELRVNFYDTSYNRNDVLNEVINKAQA